MKIKMTLIAFFASALMFTSCVKNEVSPGIEDVRAAYAELLSAQAQATVIAANAQANFLSAQAAYETARAALTNAQAAALASATADEHAAAQQALALAQANLAQQLELWAQQNDAAALAQQKALDAYEAALAAAKNVVAIDYFGKYKAALAELQAVQKAILDKNVEIAALEEDVLNGTTVAYDAAVAKQATAKANLAALKAEKATAETLGDAGVKARLTQLTADLAANEKARLTAIAAFTELNLDYSAEATAAATAAGKVTTAEGKLAAAKADVANVDALFAAAYPHASPPEFWLDADSILKAAAAALAAGHDSTAYKVWQDSVKFVATGVTSLEAALAKLNDTVTKRQAAVDKITADSVAAWNAWKAAVAAEVLSDTAEDVAKRLVNSTKAILDTATGTRVAVAQVNYDVALADYNYINVVSHPAAVALVATKASAMTAATTKYNTLMPAAKTALTDAKDAVTAKKAEITKAKALIKGLNDGRLADLKSFWLYTASFFTDLQAAYDAAYAAKEALREDYETYMGAFYASFLADLNAAVDAANTALTAAKAAKTAADAALKLAKAPETAHLKVLADLADAKVLIDALIAAYTPLAAFNAAAIAAAFDAAIAAATTAVTNATNAVAAIAQAYEDDKVNYDIFNTQLAKLNAELAAASAMADYWKALLDAALASL